MFGAKSSRTNRNDKLKNCERDDKHKKISPCPAGECRLHVDDNRTPSLWSAQWVCDARFHSNRILSFLSFFHSVQTFNIVLSAARSLVYRISFESSFWSIFHCWWRWRHRNQRWWCRALALYSRLKNTRAKELASSVERALAMNHLVWKPKQMVELKRARKR